MLTYDIPVPDTVTVLLKYAYKTMGKAGNMLHSCWLFCVHG